MDGVNLLFVQLIGDKHNAQEILFKIKQWDRAIESLDLQAITDMCSDHFKVFDVSSQQNNVSEFKQLWEKYSGDFVDDVRVYRRKVEIHAKSDLSFMHCYSKIDYADTTRALNLPWCRTTFCFEKIQGKWKVAHQHISIPNSLH